MSHAHKSIRECVRATYRARINLGFADRAELEKYIRSISESPCITAREYQNFRHMAIEKFYSEVQKMERRYQVVTYSRDIGSDERMDYLTLKQAVREAKKYRKSEEFAAVYDYYSKIAYVVFGGMDLARDKVFSDSVTIAEIA